MKRFFLVSLMCVAAVVNAAAAFTLTASKVTITDMTVDKNNFFVVVDAATSSGKYVISFDVWPEKRSAIGSFTAEDKTIGFIGCSVHKTEANGSPVNMWYYSEEDAAITLSILSNGDGTCTLKGSIQATRKETTYTYNISDFVFEYSEDGSGDPEPEKDPYRFEPAEPVSFDFIADVVHFRERDSYIEITLNEMANETYNWIELRLLSDTMAWPAGSYSIDASGKQGSLTASKGYLGGTKGDDPCYVAIRGNLEDWGQYTPYYLESGNLQVSYNAKGDTIRVTGTVLSHNGSTIQVNARSYNMLYVPEEQPKEPEHLTLGIDTVVVTYLSNLSDSTNNRFLYTMDFSQSDDYPNVLVDLTLSKPMELVAGTYTLEDGSLSGIMLSQNQSDFEMNIFAGGAYEFTAATLTLTPEKDDLWRFEMLMEDVIGSTYRFTLVQDPHILFYPQEEVDPKDQPYADEQKEKAVVTVALDLIEWKAETVSQDGILDIMLSQKEADANGLRAYLHLGMYTSAEYPEAGTYPVNGSEEAGSFSASLGRYGNVLIPCYLVLLDDYGWAHAVWYITEGNITLAYDDAAQPILSGECGTWFGSTIKFSYRPAAEGIEAVSNPQHSASRKVLRNGVLLIEQGTKTYNAQGALLNRNE